MMSIFIAIYLVVVALTSVVILSALAVAKTSDQNEDVDLKNATSELKTLIYFNEFE